MKTWAILFITCAAVSILQHFTGWTGILVLVVVLLVVYWTIE